MRALVITGAGDEGVVEVQELPEAVPGPGEVSIDVAFAGVNFADVMVLRGDHAYSAGWPYVPGLEVSGVVREVGPGVPELIAGQSVTAYTYGGAMSEIAVARADLVVPLPKDVSLATAAAVPVTLSTAYLLVADGVRLRAGDSVLVHSASGGIGIALAALARLYEPTHLIGTVGRPEKVAVAEANGYDAVFVRDDSLVDRVLKVTGGQGLSVILGALGTDLLEGDIRMAAAGGRILRYGNAPGGPHADLPPLATLNSGNLSIGGFSRRALAKAEPARVAAALKASVDLLADGKLTLPVEQIGGLESVPAFFDAMAQGETAGKYVVRVAA